MANISYIRVSSTSQNLSRQRMLMNGQSIDKEFADKVSGKNTARPGLQAMLLYVRENDTLYVESISRLARNTKDFLNIFDQLKLKGVRLVSLKEGIDTDTVQGKFILTVFAALSELERDYIRERQREGIEVAKVGHRHLGRPKTVLSKTFKKNYEDWKSGKITAVQFMRLENLKKSTFYKLVKEYEEKLYGRN